MGEAVAVLGLVLLFWAIRRHGRPRVAELHGPSLWLGMARRGGGLKFGERSAEGPGERPDAGKPEGSGA